MKALFRGVQLLKKINFITYNDCKRLHPDQFSPSPRIYNTYKNIKFSFQVERICKIMSLLKTLFCTTDKIIEKKPCPLKIIIKK